MFIANQMSIEAIAHEYVPGAKVFYTATGIVIFFSLRDIYYNQSEINAFWRMCNQQHLRPVAKTILGRIRAIRLEA